MFMDKNEAGHLFLCNTTVATSDGLGTTLTALFIFLSMALFCLPFRFGLKLLHI